MPVTIPVHEVPRQSSGVRRETVYVGLWKPLIDRAVSSLLILLLAIPMALVAVLVKVSLGRGVIFNQVRVGLHGVPFTVFKVPDNAPGETPSAPAHLVS